MMWNLRRARIFFADQFNHESLTRRAHYGTLTIIAATAFGILMIANVSVASAAVNVCSKTITACGCSITTAGVYTVEQDLTFAPGVGDCIAIGAKNVALNLNGHNLTGPGKASTGAGIHLKKIVSVSIEGQGTASQPSIISAWKYGIENEGSDVLIENIDATSNATAGIYFFKANNSQVVNFNSSNNSGYGVWLSSGANNQVGTGTTTNNVLDGVFVGCVGNGSGGCASTGGNAKSNIIYNMTSNTNGDGGITIQFNSDFNQIGKCTASGNGTTDLIDSHSGANNCAHDLWFANSPGTVNKSCVQ